MGGESNSRKRKRDSTVDPPETPEVSVAPVIYKCRFNVPNEPTKVWYATGFQRVEEASRADRYTLVFVRDERYKRLADKLTPVLATEDDRRRYDSERGSTTQFAVHSGSKNKTIQLVRVERAGSGGKIMFFCVGKKKKWLPNPATTANVQNRKFSSNRSGKTEVSRGTREIPTWDGMPHFKKIKVGTSHLQINRHGTSHLYVMFRLGIPLGISHLWGHPTTVFSWDVPNGFMGCPKWFRGPSQMILWDVPDGSVGHPTCVCGTSPRLKWDIPHLLMGCPTCPTAHNAEAVGAHLSDVQGGGTFMQAHLIRNAEAYSSGTEVVGAHPSNVQGEGTFMQAHLIRNAEVYSSGTEAVGAHPSNVQGGGTFMQAHLIHNAKAYSSGTEAIGAHPYDTQGRGACKPHTGKVVAAGAEPSDTQGWSGT
ncbi:hypothetical protein B0H17DRAFT_1149444 [Mycena rosella]|uniref:Uncharacterized protein n=1 Tax=Mycena rosella TaxID=1033263 RepID=A0AAD7C2U3_MYCRO|nr:hypothetical protein B0H17DRAFT_1149444 [Mycena rosella]